MRTTLTLDDSLAKRLKDEAHRSGRSFKAVVNEAIRAGLAGASKKPARKYRRRAHSLGQARPGVDLDKALHLADLLEDEEIVRKLELKK